jgi:hypothetical protein
MSSNETDEPHKITPSELRAHATALVELGLMPTLQDVLTAVAETGEI